MTQFMKLFFTSAVVFLIFDLFWLLVVSKKMYEHFIGDLMGDVRIFPAVIFYVIYVIGVTFFVLIPGTEKGSIGYVILAGALFGLICYATYDLTNLATLKDWPVAMTVIDLIWGTAVTTVTSVIVYFINMNFFGGGS
ncbi:DUF2177 family protein [Listeria seeligeri]|uniref:DUF2177 family protein n=1 Tax=Listeria seeligeri TaxID=1640 RepID=UPI0010D1C4CA|nr:DUF2177 family protein [Listeria seeligeri]MBC1429129.1 DUF2177 family protein [Listeria seeligeri]MBC1444781.1 DUF2177 family protein [Listeria seeligeri]MBC1472777.1 DUF2177 family protein [Listeria seeligeri]MBC1527077.1 DUF2177 family protein [Listeria seeligeri]MBC1532518.1 DUF2177 family protein [Listeria seeligeri]